MPEQKTHGLECAHSCTRASIANMLLKIEHAHPQNDSSPSTTWNPDPQRQRALQKGWCETQYCRRKAYWAAGWARIAILQAQGILSCRLGQDCYIADVRHTELQVGPGLLYCRRKAYWAAGWTRIAILQAQGILSWRLGQDCYTAGWTRIAILQAQGMLSWRLGQDCYTAGWARIAILQVGPGLLHCRRKAYWAAGWTRIAILQAQGILSCRLDQDCYTAGWTRIATLQAQGILSCRLDQDCSPWLMHPLFCRG
jgi:hypothetical protein